MKKFLFIALALSCAGVLNAQSQLKEFDLKNYKLPELNRLTLEFDLQQNSNSSVPGNDSSQEWEGISKESSINFDGRGNLSWYRNSAKYQGQTGTRIAFSPRTEKVKFDDNDNNDLKYKERDFSFDLRSTNYFYNANNWFIAPELYGSYSSSKRDGERQHNGYDYDDHKYRSTKLVASFSAGKGRIERVEDARQVLYILDALNKEGRLKRMPSDDEIVQIAKRISELKNERFFDSRHKRMHEIREMDALLKEMALISEDDAIYYTNLNDMWQYGSNVERLSGTRLSIGLSPLYDQYKSESDGGSSYENTRNQSGINGFIRFNYENPFHQKWQSSFSSQLSYGSIKGEEERSRQIYYPYPHDYYDSYSENMDFDYDQIKIDLEYTLGFYPNTRTHAAVNAAVNYMITDGQLEGNDIEEDFDNKDINGSLRFDLNYYISPQVRLRCSTGTNYASTESQELSYFIYSFGGSSYKWRNFFEVGLSFSIY